MRPFRFGVLTGAGSPDDLRSIATEAEARGYSTLALSDHLDLSGAHVARLSWLPALAYAAACTSTLRLTTMVANQDLRHPAVLAREVVSLDILAGGRVELGLGAGWNPVEYRWAGLSLDPPKQRIARLAEYVSVVRGLVEPDREDAFDFAGEHFVVSAMPRVPASPQRPLPIMLGGSQPTMLALAASRADIVNILTLRETGSTDDVLAPRIRWIRDAANVAGRDPEVGMSVVLVAADADDPADAVREALPRSPFARHVAASQSVEAISKAPHVLAGSTGLIEAELRRRREVWGVSYYIIPAESMSDFQPVLDALSGA